MLEAYLVRDNVIKSAYTRMLEAYLVRDNVIKSAYTRMLYYLPPFGLLVFI